MAGTREMREEFRADLKIVNPEFRWQKKLFNNFNFVSKEFHFNPFRFKFYVTMSRLVTQMHPFKSYL